MTTYTAEDADRVFAQDMAEVHERYARLAVGQRPAVRRAIADLTGIAPTTDEGTESEPTDDSDDQDVELDHGLGEQ